MYTKGDIVLIPFPFTDLSGAKVRPAVVISSYKKSQDIVVVFITSQIKQAGQYCVRVEPNEYNGLKIISAIVCDKIATLDKKIVVGKIGTCTPDILAGCDCELRKLFKL